MIHVILQNGLPSAENPYVFNGDFVDRGRKGMEVFLLLLTCFLVFPDGVYLNRGNHEDHVMNTRKQTCFLIHDENPFSEVFYLFVSVCLQVVLVWTVSTEHNITISEAPSSDLSNFWSNCLLQLGLRL
ncbi:unnamed protein product [Nezara viridula]|uniref:Serine/threonine specific protein phosphatases domain-containing protein n=1 Tax=Nezara viridula TaxID=85310 RepID=A0A9P0MLX5_NEZVI|nr:unnamed protein product [Nezara viridula]